MRKLKFRVWDTSYKKFIPSEYIELNWDGEVVSVYDDGRDVEDANRNKDAVLMQFTGLHDRNGKEIYEGDLLKWSYVNPLSGDEVTKLYEVAFDKGNFYARLVGHHPYGTTMLYFANKDGEVIGNIYQNSELLEATP